MKRSKNSEGAVFELCANVDMETKTEIGLKDMCEDIWTKNTSSVLQCLEKLAKFHSIL